MDQNKHSSSIIRGTGIVATLTLLSRVLGLLREILVGRAFGTGALADAFFVAFRIPNLLRSFVAEGALTSAFVPVFAQELQKSKAQGQQTLRAISGLLLTATLILTVLGIVFAREIVSLFAPGFMADPEKASVCMQLTQIMLPYIMCVSLVAMLNGALNTLGIFGTSAWAQVVMNIVLILGALLAGWWDEVSGVYVLAISVLIGGIIQVFIQIPALRKATLAIVPSREFLTPATKQILVLMVPAILGATVYQISIFINTLLASLLTPGSVSYLYYADRLAQLPIGIFTISLGSVLLPALSKAHSAKDGQAFADSLSNALRYSSFILIPISAGLAYWALDLTVVFFERGAFDQKSSVMTAVAVQAYSLGLWGIGCASLLSRAFIARKDTLTPTLIGIVTLIVTTTLAVLFMGTPVSGEGTVAFKAIVMLQNAPQIGSLTHALGLGATGLGHQGLALASTVGSALSFLILAFLTKRRLKLLHWQPFLASTLKTTIAAVGTVLVIEVLPMQSFGVFARLLTEVAVAAICFLVISRMLKSTELQETFALFSRITSRRDR